MGGRKTVRVGAGAGTSIELPERDKAAEHPNPTA
jgi:hypothetical protein